MWLTRFYIFLILSLFWTSGSLTAQERTTLDNLLNDHSLKSSQGHELSLLTYQTPISSAAEPKYRIYFQARLHGNEELSTDFVLWLAQRIKEGAGPINDLKGVSLGFDFSPMINPDGANANERFNTNGVDLNRNFSILWGKSSSPAGESAFSEPETKAIRSLFLARKYLLAFDIHGYANWIVVPSAANNIPNAISEQKKMQYSFWRNLVTTETPFLGNYETKTGASLGDGGAFEDWAFWKEGVFALCLELSKPQRFFYLTTLVQHNLVNFRQSKYLDSYLAYEKFLFRIIGQVIKTKEKEEIIAFDKNLPKSISITRNPVH